MDAYARAIRDTPQEMLREIARYGGMNPHGRPSWRVVLAQNVLDQTFGVMRHMPCVTADADVMEIEPERVEAGEFWTPRYSGQGWILERWFPAPTWGSEQDWELEQAEDGRRRMGAWPRHGDYYMVSEEYLAELAPIGFWKNEIQKELRRIAELPGDPATHLATTLYLARVREEKRNERFLEEVNAIHRGLTDPILATVGRTAQQVRDAVSAELGFTGNLAAG